MLPNPDLEGIVLRLEDPFRGMQEALDTLKSSNLTGLADVQQYARRLIDVYRIATGRIDRAVEEARTRGQTIIDQYSQSIEGHDVLGEYDSQAQKARVLWVKLDVDQKLRGLKLEAESMKEDLPQRLQQELANEFVDVRTKFAYVIFKTPEGTYGVDLNEPGKGIRNAEYVPPFFGVEGYLLRKAVAPIPENK